MTIKVKPLLSFRMRPTVYSSLTLSFALSVLPLAAQQKPATQPAQPAAAQAAAATQKEPDRASAYYHFGLAHMYEEMATNYGRPEYATRAIEEYKLALDADPGSKYLNR